MTRATQLCDLHSDRTEGSFTKQKSQVDQTARCTHTDSSEDSRTEYGDARTSETITYDNNPLTTGLNASGCGVFTEKQQTVK